MKEGQTTVELTHMNTLYMRKIEPKLETQF